MTQRERCSFYCPTLWAQVYEEPIVRARQPGASAKDTALGEARSLELSSLIQSFFLRRTNEINARYYQNRLLSLSLLSLSLLSLSRPKNSRTGRLLHRPAADLLGDCCHRYLPPKHEYVVFVRPTAAQARVYETLSKSKVVTSCLAGSSGSGAAYLVAINALRKAANCPQLLSASASKEDAEGPKSEWADVTVSDDLGAKLSVLQSLLIDVAARTEERVVVVSNSTKCLDVISSMCTRSGSVSMSCPP
jgi:DNA repair and recombination protein RAD54B